MSTKLEEIGKLKEGRFIVLDGVACKITGMQKSAPGKHGHAKYRVSAVDIITNSKKIVVMSGHEKVQVPMIDKRTAQVLSVSGNTANVMDMESYENFDLEIPTELKDDIEAGKGVLFWVILDKKVMKEIKNI